MRVLRGSWKEDAGRTARPPVSREGALSRDKSQDSHVHTLYSETARTVVTTRTQITNMLNPKPRICKTLRHTVTPQTSNLLGSKSKYPKSEIPPKLRSAPSKKLMGFRV